jgi:ferredoxin-fold anticodon binding domain-containing protein
LKTFVFAGQIDGYRSLADRSMKISMVTSTEVTPETILNIAKTLRKECVIAISPDKFTSDELEAIDKIKIDFDDGNKTPGQRLRGVFFRMYEQNNERYDTFIDYYNAHMEKLIEHFKGKLA